jgi:hypothetical protein
VGVVAVWIAARQLGGVRKQITADLRPYLAVDVTPEWLSNESLEWLKFEIHNTGRTAAANVTLVTIEGLPGAEEEHKINLYSRIVVPGSKLPVWIGARAISVGSDGIAVLLARIRYTSAHDASTIYDEEISLEGAIRMVSGTLPPIDVDLEP